MVQKDHCKDKSICLHSKEIEFEHPVNKEILVLKCDPPDEFIPKNLNLNIFILTFIGLLVI